MTVSNPLRQVNSAKPYSRVALLVFPLPAFSLLICTKLHIFAASWKYANEKTLSSARNALPQKRDDVQTSNERTRTNVQERVYQETSMADTIQTHATQLPRLSIVTICFNAERFIRQTIESVLAQDYPALEYSVVDGGSKDATPAIIAEYSSRLAWWISEPDSGVSEAFNKGIARHTGEFIGFLNAGDYFASPTALSTLFAATDSSADIVYGKARLKFDPPVRGHTEMIVGAPYRPIHKLPTAHQAMFYRRTMWERYGMFRVDYRYAMDYEHYLRFRRDEARGAVRYSFADVIVAERPLTAARNSFGNPSRTYREYLRADREHGNSGIVMNTLKFLRDRLMEQIK